MNERVAIRAQELIRIFRTRTVRFRALRGVCLEVERGSITAITGTSGSGKSTLLQLLAGLDRPSSGSIWVLGENLTEMSEEEMTVFRRTHIGFIFQDYALLPMTAQDNVAFPLLLAGVPESERRHRARDMLASLGMDSHAEHYPEELSGGQQQRVCIARALITKPKVLFADEPTGSLDSVSAGEVMSLLVQAVRDEDRTLVMVTHDLEKAAQADRIVRMADGQIVGGAN